MIDYHGMEFTSVELGPIHGIPVQTRDDFRRFFHPDCFALYKAFLWSRWKAIGMRACDAVKTRQTPFN